METEKGAAKEVLLECYEKTLKRLVKNHDYALDKMNNVLSVS